MKMKKGRCEDVDGEMLFLCAIRIPNKKNDDDVEVFYDSINHPTSI